MNIQTLANTIPVEGEQELIGIDFISSGEQYLTFTLADELYAVDILCVEEIRCWETPTIIPNAPDYVKGVINMRGVIVPIIDLRIRFAIGLPIYEPTTVVVVLRVDSETQTKVIGFVVDTVADVLNADVNDVQPVPVLGGTIAQHYIHGLVNSGNQVITILNVASLQLNEPR